METEGNAATSFEIQTVKSEELLKTLFTGRNSIKTETVASTNQLASERILAHSPAEGTAVLAGFQSAGKGQAGAVWESEPGQNLLISYIFYPKFIEPKDLFNLNKAIALGVHDYLKSVLKDHVYIKWPNDILYHEKKIAGILIENSVTFSQVNHSVVGIGINVNQQKFRHYIPEAISMKNITEKTYNLNDCFAALSTFLESRYLQLKQSNLKTIDADYRSALYRFGQYSVFRKKRTVFNAKINGVTNDGQLILEDDKGKMETFRFKEVGFANEWWHMDKKRARDKAGQALLSGENNS